MKITKETITGILFALDWRGHIELPDGDICWIAGEVAHALTGSKKGRCENCGNPSTIIIKATIGDICEECIGAIGKMADAVREEYESGSISRFTPDFDIHNKD